MDYNIFITDLAIKEIKKQLLNHINIDASFRIGVKGSGCNGYSYHFQFDDKPPSSKDLIFNFDNLQVLVDKKSILLINGMTLDWQSSLLKQGFVINNPNQKKTCGCGSSFST